MGKTACATSSTMCVCSAPVTVYFCCMYVSMKLNHQVDTQCSTLLGGLKWCRAQGGEVMGLTPQTEGSSGAATCSFSAAGLWLCSRRLRLCWFAGLRLGSGHPRLRSLYCRKAPIGVGHALFVLSDDQLTRIFHSANNALCCAFTNCVCLCVCARACMRVCVCVCVCVFSSTPSSTFLRPEEIR